MTDGRYRRVVECRSQEMAGGEVRWAAKLECGAVIYRTKRAPGGRVDKPAPVRAKCRCPKCG